MLAPCPEQTGNFRRSAFGGELPERRPAPVRRAGERRQAREEASHFLIPAQGGVVKGRGSLGISSRHERQPLGEEPTNATEISGGDRFE